MESKEVVVGREPNVVVGRLEATVDGRLASGEEDAEGRVTVDKASVAVSVAPLVMVEMSWLTLAINAGSGC